VSCFVPAFGAELRKSGCAVPVAVIPAKAGIHEGGVSHYPFGLRYRSLVPLSRWWSCSLREAESGCAPDRAVTFSCLPKRKSPKRRAPSSPVGLGPTALRCSVFAARAELATRPAAAALRQLREVRLRGALSRPAAKPCAARRLRRGPRAMRSFASQTFPVYASLRIGLGVAQRGEGLRYLSPSGRSVLAGLCTPSVSHTPPSVPCTPTPIRCTPPPVRAEVSKPCSETRTPPSRCAASRVWCSAPPSDELSSTGLCGSARQRASTTDFGQLLERSGRRPRSEFCPTRKDRAAQGSPRNARAESAGSFLCLLSCRHKKVGRPPGRIPGAASRSEQEHQRESGARLRYAERTLS
jgi:hypothetical protein